MKPSSAGKEAKSCTNDRQSSGKPHVSVSQAPAKMPPKSTGVERLKQLEEMRKIALADGMIVEKYDKAIEALKLKLEQEKISE